MPAEPLFSHDLEYQTLRDEALAAKKHVFERPLAIAALAIAGFKFLDGENLFILPLSVAVLILFNFRFTANRSGSAARIVAYIQLELEERAYGSWIGWETCLRFYRIWENSTRDAEKQVVETIDPKAVPDALQYYGLIYYFHMGLAFLAVIGAAGIVWTQYSKINAIFAIVTFIIACFSGHDFWKFRPADMVKLIERKRAQWILVFQHMQKSGAK